MTASADFDAACRAATRLTSGAIVTLHDSASERSGTGQLNARFSHLVTPHQSSSYPATGCVTLTEYKLNDQRSDQL